VGKLNDYFTLAGEIIDRHGGFIDKFVGDGIIAIFGSPIHRSDHASAAVAAAQEFQSRLRAAPFAAFRTRIGIHTGPAVVGNIGSSSRFNYTAIGDTVNLASRLEGANKSLGSLLLVSEATRLACGPEHEFRELGKLKVVGRETGICVYEPLHQPIDRAAQEGFSCALGWFRAGDFARAQAAFAALASQDAVSAKLAVYARAFMQSPPPPDWDGTLELSAK
jgi:adenylate cyclase